MAIRGLAPLALLLALLLAGCHETVAPDPAAAVAKAYGAVSQADRLAISNSSFSFTAAMLNTGAQEFVRPDPDLRSLVPFEPWDAQILLPPAIAGETK